MALTDAQKQANWRVRHADQRRQVARITTLLMRQSRSKGRTIEAKIGWNTVNIDEYFCELAAAIAGVLKTKRASKQLRWALVCRERN